MSPKETVKLKSAYAMLVVLGLREAHIKMLIDSPAGVSAYTYLRNQGYRWSADLVRWVPIKRGENAVAISKTGTKSYVNMYADVKRADVDGFIANWRDAAELIDWAIVDTKKQDRAESAFVRVYLRFKKQG